MTENESEYLIREREARLERLRNGLKNPNANSNTKYPPEPRLWPTSTDVELILNRFKRPTTGKVSFRKRGGIIKGR